MIIENTDRPGLRLLIGADECLLLADACRSHADQVDDGGADAPPASLTEGALFRALGLAFEACALVNAAYGSLPPRDYPALNVSAVRAAYGVLRSDRRAS